MKNFTIKMNKFCKNNGNLIIIICTILIVWQGLSKVTSPIVLPSPKLTMKALIGIVRNNRFHLEVLVTCERFLIGVVISISIGSVLGILMGSSKIINSFIEPLIYFIQATPPILYMSIAMIWFGLDGRATIFIIFLASIPIMAINIKEGFDNIDMQLIEMGNIFKFSKIKTIKEIVLPSLRSYFKSGINIVIGYGWKLVVMGEVLSSSSGIGSKITDARMNLETDKVFAWGFIVILLCFLSQKTIWGIEGMKMIWRKSYDTKNG